MLTIRLKYSICLTRNSWSAEIEKYYYKNTIIIHMHESFVGITPYKTCNHPKHHANIIPFWQSQKGEEKLYI